MGLAVATVASTHAVAAADPAPTYYLALGDSLSVGYQPAHVDANGNLVPAGDTKDGYADQLFPILHAKDPNLHLMKLGCSGETTTTMLNGSTTLTGPNCSSYKGGNTQVKAAEAFVAAHPGQVKYVPTTSAPTTCSAAPARPESTSHVPCRALPRLRATFR